MKRRILALSMAVILTVGVFPDVIFQNATITMNGLYNGFIAGYWEGPTQKPIQANQQSYRRWSDQVFDYAASLWQTEPVVPFVAHTLKAGDSIYWNPYSGAGQYGLETIGDQKLSVPWLLIALLGATQTAFHVVFLGMFFVAVSVLAFVAMEYLSVSGLAAATACIVFALNGYATTYLFANPEKVIFFFPLLLWALFAFSRKTTVMRFVGIVCADAIILASTFFPTTLLVLITTHLLGFAFAIATQGKKSPKIIGFQMLGGLWAVLILSFIFLPIIDCFKHLTTINTYGARTYVFSNWYSVLSLFTPNHFWEEYRAHNLDFSPNIFARTNSYLVFHMGITSSLVAAAALFNTTRVARAVAFAALVCLSVSLGRNFGIPIISDVIGNLPYLKSIGNTYWFIMTTVSFVMLVAVGFDPAVGKLRRPLISSAVIAAVGLAGAWFVFRNYAFDTTSVYAIDIATARGYLLKAGLFLTAGFLLIGLCRVLPRKALAVTQALLALLIFAELSSYVIKYRCSRREVFHNPPAAISFLKSNIGDGRVACIGNYLLPPEYGAAFQIPQIESLEMNLLPRYTKFFVDAFLPTKNVRWGPYPYPTMQMYQDDTTFNRQALDLLSVKYIIISNLLPQQHNKLLQQKCRTAFESADVWILENETRLPRVFAVESLTPGLLNWKAAGGQGLIRTAWTDDEMLLAEAKNLNIPVGEAGTEGGGVAGKLSVYRNASLTFDITLTKPSVVVLMDNYHPYWRAFDNGKPVRIGRINDSFRGIALPAGVHKISMYYEPAILKFSQVVTIASLLLLLCAIGMRRRLDPKLLAITDGTFVKIDSEAPNQTDRCSVAR